MDRNRERIRVTDFIKTLLNKIHCGEVPTEYFILLLYCILRFFQEDFGGLLNSGEFG
jgi:hypothetical protein